MIAALHPMTNQADAVLLAGVLLASPQSVYVSALFDDLQ
jgi:hypothetical protein